MTKIQYTNAYELAELPWFDLDDGRLIVSDRDAVGPIIDCHTHFALNFITRGVDITKKTRPAEHYLPLDSALDLEVYQNKNFSEPALEAMKRDLVANAVRDRGMRQTHTIPNMLQEMDEMNIAHSVILPIDLPLISRNAINQLRLIQDNPRFIGHGSIHPMSIRHDAKLDRQQSLGAKGVKMHPAVQMIRPNHPRAMNLYRLCGHRHMSVTWHCGPVDIELEASRRRCQLPLYTPAVEEHPDTIFVLGHSGALQMEQGLELGTTYPNVYLEIAGQGLSNLTTIVNEMDPDRIVFGTDWPFYHQSLAIAKVMLATEDKPHLRRKIFYENAARLYGLSSEPAPDSTAP